jgi:cytochrome c2
MAAIVIACAAEAHPIVAGFERFYRGAKDQDATAEGGLLLLNELNCVACHQVPDTWRGRLTGRGTISLAGVGGRMAAAGLRALAEDPSGVKPGTTMPAVVRDDPAAAEAIGVFLSSLREGRPAPATGLGPKGDAAGGGKLFNSIGCAACHATGNGKPSGGAVPIGLAVHYDEQALAEFLQNPLHARPGGRMPAFKLSSARRAEKGADGALAHQTSDAPPQKPQCQEWAGTHPRYGLDPPAARRGRRSCRARPLGRRPSYRRE